MLSQSILNPVFAAFRKGLPIVFAIASGMFVAGCASTPAPTEQIAVARAAVMHASNADTSQYAPVELKSARDKLSRAEQAMTDEKYELARQLAAEAQVDARLAESRTESAKAQKAAQDAQEATGVLREELNRKAQ